MQNHHKMVSAWGNHHPRPNRRTNHATEGAKARHGRGAGLGVMTCMVKGWLRINGYM